MSEPGSKTEKDYPYAEITRMGRFKYEVYIRWCFPKHTGWWSGTPYTTFFGRRWAERLAKRKMTRYLRRKEWRRQVWVVRPDSKPVS